jgi:glucose-1-phosphate adenylyltransferase
MRSQPNVLAIVLAGGEGKRLFPLTADRAKPAVPFGGAYRLIDFVLSNLVNAGYLRICVLTQYKSHSLDRHISQAWRLSGLAGDYITSVPAQQRLGPRWYTGSADAILQSLNLIHDEDPEYIMVFGADNVYRMDPKQMLKQHIAMGVGVTVAGIRVPKAEATAFGCIDSDDSKMITGWLEKPADPPTIPGMPDTTFASMGNYIFSTKTLVDALMADSEDGDSDHDMGGDIIPRLVNDGQAAVYDFNANIVPGATEQERGYWRDVGTIDAFYEAHMDLVSVTPQFNLYNRKWPIRGAVDTNPPAKFVRGGVAMESVVGAGCIISAATVRNSVLATDVIIEDGAIVDASVLMPGVRIGRGAVVKKAILDKNVQVGEGEQVGVDLARDRQRGFAISAGGVVSVGKGVWI